MKRYIAGFAAIVVAVAAAAFTKAPEKKVSGPEFVDYYFQFTGARNSEGGDRTKWTMLATQTLPAYTALSCPGANNGCKLIATALDTISGIPRPQQVYTTGTGAPTTGTHVAQVANTNNP